MSNSMIAPKPQVITSRNEMLNASFSRRFFSHGQSLLGMNKRTVSAHGQTPVGESRFRVSFQRRQDHVDGHIARNLFYGPGKQVEALFAGNSNPPNPSGTLGGQTVRDEVNVIRLGAQLADGGKGPLQVGAAFRHDLAERLDNRVQFRLVADVQPLPGQPRHYRSRFRMKT